MLPSRSRTAPDEDHAANALLRRIGWRTLPLLLLLYLIAYLDRVNIGFAAISMQRDLHFSDSLYGTGAGMFFLGYFIAQVPSNLLLARFGARRTIAVLMIIWSLVSASVAFVHTPLAFLSLRFLLGIAEAGFYPGVILYLTLWLPRRVRTSYTGWFIFAIPLASIFGGPLSTWILQHGAVGRFNDWQMLLLTQAAPALLMGTCLPLFMADTPQEASWLTNEDRASLARMREVDEPQSASSEEIVHSRFRFGALSHLLTFALIYFSIQFGLYALNFFLPKILQALHVASQRVGWNVAIVYAIAAVAMIVWGRIADLSPNSKWTLGVPLFAGALGYAATTIPAAHIGYILLAFGIGAAGGLAATPAFWSQATLGQKPSEVAAMIALINALGNLGGFAGPSVLGRLQQITGSHVAGMLVASAGLLLGALLLYASRPSYRTANE